MPPSASASERRLLVALLAAALAWRLACFVGVNGGDDPRYSELARVSVSSLPEDLRQGGPAVHRLGLLLPTRAAYAILGPGERAAAVYPLLCALGTVALAWAIGRRLLGTEGGFLAGALAAFCPHSAGWSSVLSPDIPMGFWAAAAAWALLNGHCLAGGLLLGLATASRETALGLAPLALAAAWTRGRLRGGLLLCVGLAAGLWLPAPDGRLFRGLFYYLTGNYLSISPDDVPASAVRVYFTEQGEGLLGRWRVLVPWDYRFRAFGGIATLGTLAAVLAVIRRKTELAWVGGWGLSYLFLVMLAASPRSPSNPILVAQARYLLPALVPFAVLSAWAMSRIRWKPWILGIWGAYLLYEGAVGSMQQRAFAKPWREVSAWLESGKEACAYAPLWGTATLRYLGGYVEPPRLEVYPSVPEWWAPGSYLRHQLGKPPPVMLPPGPVWEPGGLVVVDLDQKAPPVPDRIVIPASWTEVRRWTVVVEVGPRARLARLLGRPGPPPLTRTLAAYRIPGAT